MKRFFTVYNTLAIVVFMMAATVGFSQRDSSGIYFTVHDYRNHKLSFAINCNTQKHKIKSDMIFRQNEISIRHEDSTYSFQKDSVYGIRYCDGFMARLYDNTQYPLINPEEPIMVYKVASGTGIKNMPVVTNYFFSRDEESKIQDLTLYNLKAAFPDNHKFHDLIDMEFHSDDELAKYDNFHKIMKINHVLQHSLDTK